MVEKHSNLPPAGPESMTGRFADFLPGVRPRVLGILAGLAATFFWAYWPALCEMARKWSGDTQYSRGYLVPLFSLAVLWLRRESVSGVDPQPSWWGAALLLVGVLGRLAGAVVFFAWL